MTKTNRYWYEQIIRRILDVNADVLFIVDEIGLSDFPGVKNALLKKYSDIIPYENEIKLRILLKRKEISIIIRFRDEKDIPYQMLSSYALVTLDTDIVFPLLDRKVISEQSMDSYQAVYELYIDEIRDNVFERLSEEKTREFIDKVLMMSDIVHTERINVLRSTIEELLEHPVSGINDWIGNCGMIAEAWGELLFLIDTIDSTFPLEDLRERMNMKFVNEVRDYYDDTIYSSNLPVQWNVIERIRRDEGQKNAVICFDCMGFEEWNVLKEYLEDLEDIKFEIGHTLAIIPTETNFSRTTLFSGIPPRKILETGLANSVETRYEKRLFKYTLSKYGISDHDVYYQRATSSDDLDIPFDSFQDYEWLGIVFTFMDTLSHNNLISKSKLINDIKEFLSKSNLYVFVQKLIDQGFRIFLVSDHGNIFAKGNGVHASKDLVNEKARRFMIFDHMELSTEYETEKTELLQFKNIIGDQWLLLETQNEMFDNLGQERITHGGISVEEVIVPFIKVVRK